MEYLMNYNLFLIIIYLLISKIFPNLIIYILLLILT